MNSVLVFRTSVANADEAQRVAPLLNGLLNDGERWNFDLEDHEKILRVANTHTNAHQLIGLLQSMGVYCEELED
ncbi:MAG TPA: hypothetical protein PL009_15005 [Flavipsychrobacter sp.]|nr:hypothetical protein [Flavipsychrobacter sp.]